MPFRYEIIRVDDEVYAEIERRMQPGDSPCAVLRKAFDLPPRINARKDSRLRKEQE